MFIVLPWPHRDLSPNARKHWRSKTKIKNDYKDECFTRAKAITFTAPSGNIPISLLFVPPRNAGDLDNMLATAKYGLDGVALALGVNDKLFRPITIDMAKADKSNPRIELTLDV